MPRRSPLLARIRLPVILLAVWGVAVHARWATLPQAMALGDSLGPWLVAFRGPWSTAPHAPPYGWLLAVPHALILAFADSLYTAFAAIRVVDALVAVFGAWAAHRLTGRSGSALAVGLLLAWDPSLIDTATSGAEAYQAAVAIALLTLCTTTRSRWSGWGAGAAFCWAVMAHPLALCAVPLLLRVRWSAASLMGTAAVLVPHILDLVGHVPSPGPGPVVVPTAALSAWVQQSGPASVVFGGSIALGLRHRRTRPLLVPTAASLVLLLLAGTHLGYLRDHHVRLWSAPAALGLATVPSPLALAAVVATRSGPPLPGGRSAHRRPGTLGLLHLTANQVVAHLPADRPVVIDGVRTVHTPAVEPGGVWLDLLLRGVPPADLDSTPRSTLVVLQTAQRHAPTLSSGDAAGLVVLDRQDTHTVWMGSPEQVRAWSRDICDEEARSSRPPPRVGGAWDGLALVHPGRGAQSVSGWWTCAGD